MSVKVNFGSGGLGGKTVEIIGNYRVIVNRDGMFEVWWSPRPDGYDAEFETECETLDHARLSAQSFVKNDEKRRS
jgi:hypothetical protein